MKAVLVASDMPLFREPIEAVLRAESLKVVLSANAHEALAAIKRERVDLVLLDLGMPNGDGVATLRALRAHGSTRDIPVVLLTSETDRGQIVEAVRLGISACVLKSRFSLKALMERVHSMLGTRAAGAPASQASDAEHEQASRKDIPLPFPPESDPKSLRPLISRTELLERVPNDENLAGFSPSVAHALQVMSNPACSMEQVARAIAQDQAVSLKVLKLANSPFYAHGDHVDTIHTAVMRIGMEQVRQLVIGIAAVERFASPSFETHLNTALFWEHSIACGLLSAELARALGHKEPESALIVGLLHDLGRLIYAERLGATYVRVLETAREQQLPLDVVESRLLLVPHSELMQRLLHAWNFPKELTGPIVSHHMSASDTRALAPQQAADALRIGLADRLSHALLLGSSGNETIYPTGPHCKALGVSGEMLASAIHAAVSKIEDTKATLLRGSGVAPWRRHADSVRAGLTRPLRALFVGMHPETDAYRIFCEQLGGGASSGAPQLAVVHVAMSADRSRIAEMLHEAEQRAGVADLPLIVLSPGASLTLEPKALVGRAHITIATPTSIARFIGAANALTAHSTRRLAA